MRKAREKPITPSHKNNKQQQQTTISKTTTRQIYKNTMAPLKFNRYIPLCGLLALLTIAEATTNLRYNNKKDNINITLVDLSEEFVTSPEFNNNPKWTKFVNTALERVPNLRTMLILERGQIVAEYIRDDITHLMPKDNDDEDSLVSHIWSATKSWTGLIIGMLIDRGVLSLDDTLGDIWPPASETTIWKGVTDNPVDFMQQITIQQLLTMSSGLDPRMERLIYDGPFEPNLGGANLTDSLNYAVVNDGSNDCIGGGGPGRFSYLPALNILSYVIKERSPGNLTPREFMAKYVYPNLGIDNTQTEWLTNDDSVEMSFHGLHLAPRQMAKLGQLYLQNGVASTSQQQLISSEWVRESTTSHIDTIYGMDYGYLFWVVPENNNKQSRLYCASGFGGQAICVDRVTEHVFVQQKDLYSLLDVTKDGFEELTSLINLGYDNDDYTTEGTSTKKQGLRGRSGN